MKTDQLPPDVLRDIAQNVRAYADTLDRAADHNERRIHEARELANHKTAIEYASKHYYALVMKGADQTKALHLASSKHCVAVNDLRIAWPSLRSKIKRRFDGERDRDIARRFRSGQAVSAIATDLGVNRRTIQRTLTRLQLYQAK